LFSPLRLRIALQTDRPPGEHRVDIAIAAGFGRTA